MKPKKKDDILNITFDKLPQYSKDNIDSVVNFFWRKGVYQNINNITYFSLNIPSLGKFEFIRKNIDPLIDRLSNIPEGDRRYEDCQSKLVKVKAVKEKLLKEYERLNEKRKIKEEYYKSMEEQVENT